MDGFELAALIAGMFASLSAVFLAGLSFRTYLELTPQAQQQRREDEQMEYLASIVVRMLDRTIIIQENHFGNEPVAVFHFYALVHDARQLDNVLDECSRLGLLQECLGDPNKQSSVVQRWSMNSVFRASLIELSNASREVLDALDPERSDSQDSITRQEDMDNAYYAQKEFMKQHFVFGMIRLTDACLAYQMQNASRGKEISIASDLESLLKECATQNAPYMPADGEKARDWEAFRQYCYDYLSKVSA